MKTYKKIDLYFMGDYLCSTNQSKTCKEAVNKYLENLKERKNSFAGLTFIQRIILDNPKELKANFGRE
jgi:hypothetical protein